MIKELITSLFLITFSIFLQAQSNDDHHGTGSENEKPIIEIITSGIYVHSFEHEEGVFGTEVHLTYWFNHEWGSGLSYTTKFEEGETLHDIALLGSWNPASWLTVNAGPNFGLAGAHREFAVSAYAEAEINFRLTDWFHLGPLIGTVIGKNSELTSGIQLGFEF